MKKFELSFVQEALDRLVAEDFKGVLVGGRAVNFWAYIYREMTPEWSALIPFTSEDIDFLGGRAEALLCKRLFGGVSNLNDGTDPSPQAGVILAPLKGTTIRFDIITSIIGVDSREVVKKAIGRPGAEPGKSLHVLHPLHSTPPCSAFGRLFMARRLPLPTRRRWKGSMLRFTVTNSI